MKQNQLKQVHPQNLKDVGENFKSDSKNENPNRYVRI